MECHLKGYGEGLWKAAVLDMRDDLTLFILTWCPCGSLERIKLPLMDIICYEDFGARGDGKTDDMEAIVGAHAHANSKGLPVRTRDGATYVIGGKDLTAIIGTDTDFGSAKFIIDDRDVENRKQNIFQVKGVDETFEVEGVEKLEKNQGQLNVTFPSDCIVTVKNDRVKHYIRKGLNQDEGNPQADIFMVDRNGKVHPDTPIIWDFHDISTISARVVDKTPLTIKGGHFTTIANQAESKYTYFSRGIEITRSRVTLSDLEHHITGEGDHGAPYRGFLSIKDSTDVVVKDCTLTGHKKYFTIGSANKEVAMGTYDLHVFQSLNVSFLNCRQANSIHDISLWGIMESDCSKNLLYDNCQLSRFDAHRGVANATIRNSTLGHMGLRIIGCGSLIMENTKVYSNNLLVFRPDYGSTWEGELLVKDCTFILNHEKESQGFLIGGENNGQHDFGYPCFLPHTITIEGLNIEDGDTPGDYDGPKIFSDFCPDFDKDYIEKYPLNKTKKVILRNITTASGKELQVCKNPYLFKETVISSD